MDEVHGLPPNGLKPKWAVTIEEVSKVRSRNANALYWKWLSIISQYVTMDVTDFDEHGFIRHYKKHADKDQLHSWFALRYLEPVWINHPQTGQEIPVPRSTRRLKKDEFTEYMNKIQEFAAEHDVMLPSLEDYHE